MSTIKAALATMAALPGWVVAASLGTLATIAAFLVVERLRLPKADRVPIDAIYGGSVLFMIISAGTSSAGMYVVLSAANVSGIDGSGTIADQIGVYLLCVAAGMMIWVGRALMRRNSIIANVTGAGFGVVSWFFGAMCIYAWFGDISTAAQVRIDEDGRRTAVVTMAEGAGGALSAAVEATSSVYQRTQAAYAAKQFDVDALRGRLGTGDANAEVARLESEVLALRQSSALFEGLMKCEIGEGPPGCRNARGAVVSDFRRGYNYFEAERKRDEALVAIGQIRAQIARVRERGDQTTDEIRATLSTSTVELGKLERAVEEAKAAADRALSALTGTINTVEENAGHAVTAKSEHAWRWVRSVLGRGGDSDQDVLYRLAGFMQAIIDIGCLVCAFISGQSTRPATTRRREWLGVANEAISFKAYLMSGERAARQRRNDLVRDIEADDRPTGRTMTNREKASFAAKQRWRQYREAAATGGAQRPQVVGHAMPKKGPTRRD